MVVVLWCWCCWCSCCCWWLLTSPRSCCVSRRDVVVLIEPSTPNYNPPIPSEWSTLRRMLRASQCGASPTRARQTWMVFRGAASHPMHNAPLLLFSTSAWCTPHPHPSPALPPPQSGTPNPSLLYFFKTLDKLLLFSRHVLIVSRCVASPPQQRSS